MDEAKLKEVLSDEAFVKELLELDTPEEVQAKLKDKGVEVSLEEIQQVNKALQAQAEGELDEDALEDVAGGVLIFLSGLAAGVLSSYISYSVRRRRNRW